MHPRGFQHLSRARGPQSTRARGGDGKGVTCQALVPVGDFDFFRFFEFGQFFSKLPRATRDASEKGGKKAGNEKEYSLSKKEYSLSKKEYSLRNIPINAT